MEKIYTVQELAELLQLDVLTVRKYINQGIIKGFKVGTHWRVPQASLDAYLNDAMNKS